MDMKYSMGRLSGSLKVKYKTINAILGEEFLDEWNGGFDVFIDLDTLFTAAAGSKKYMTELPFSEGVESDMAETILTTLLHWKNYMRRRENSRIFLICKKFELMCAPEREIQKTYLVPWQNKYNEDRYKQITYYWNECLKIIEKILNFVPNSYLIHCQRMDAYIVPEVIRSITETPRRRIIVSGSPLYTQYMFEPDTKVIYTRYIHTGIQQLADPIMITQAITHINEEVMAEFCKSSVFYAVLNAIIGDFNRGLIGVVNAGISKLSTDILRGVERREIPINPKSVDSVLRVIPPTMHDYIKKSFTLIDIQSHLNLVSPSLRHKVQEKMVDKYDIDSLSQLSVKGLNLIELL
jgi:hypothetical protein